MEEVLENEIRDKIIDLVIENPGIHFNKLLEKLDISPGSLVWHLDILETYKVIKKERIGQYIVYYPYTHSNPISKIEFMFNKSKTTLEIYKLIMDTPGIYQRVIANRLNLDHKTVAYHLKKLMESEIIYYETRGRKKLYYPTEIKKLEDSANM